MTTNTFNEVFVPLDAKDETLLNLIQGQDDLLQYLKGDTKSKLQVRADKAKFNSRLNERKTMIADDFWDRFLLLSKVVYMHDKEAELADVFEIMRTKVLGGWDVEPQEEANGYLRTV